MNSTVVIVILSVISTALASILIYINQDAKKKTKELKSKLDDFLKTSSEQKQVIERNKEVTVEELKNNRKQLDSLIKELSRIKTEKIPIEKVKEKLNNL